MTKDLAMATLSVLQEFGVSPVESPPMCYAVLYLAQAAGINFGFEFQLLSNFGVHSLDVEDFIKEWRRRQSDLQLTSDTLKSIEKVKSLYVEDKIEYTVFYRASAAILYIWDNRNRWVVSSIGDVASILETLHVVPETLRLFPMWKQLIDCGFIDRNLPIPKKNYVLTSSIVKMFEEQVPFSLGDKLFLLVEKGFSEVVLSELRISNKSGELNLFLVCEDSNGKSYVINSKEVKDKLFSDEKSAKSF